MEIIKLEELKAYYNKMSYIEKLKYLAGKTSYT